MQPTNVHLISALGLSMLVLAACTPKSEPAPEPAPSPQQTTQPAAPTPPAPALGGRVWQLQELNGAPPALPENARIPTIEFDMQANNASGFAGCNTFNGAFRASGEALRLGPFMTTRRACADIDAVERAFMSALAQTQTYRVTEDSLELIGPGDEILAKFKPRAY